jgi:hypothetical protein
MNNVQQKLQDTPRPILVLIRGLPGSGKSYLADTLRDSIGKDQVVLLDPDAIDLQSTEYLAICETLRSEGIEEKFYPNRFLKAKAHEAVVAHKIIIWNQPFTDLGGFERTIDNVRTFASEQHIPMPILLVEVEINHDIANERITTRRQQGGHGPSADRFARFINDYVSFADKGYPTIIVNGEDDVAI